ncbi:MAG: SAM-dependent methyltransferase [Candidatus Hydrogenedentes bacterium]|nr:SAM-dependent methyltransferase [Candidatus Hydrogenedentota bacterium]MBI3118494.1 SAM-dependent methyltransferase [Candidatus Hydrogenedentota bacterium]
MKEGQPSRTAEYMALFRALESARPDGQRLFSDPFAQEFLSSALTGAVRAARLPLAHWVICRYIDTRWPGVRTSGVGRTRFIDDALLSALREGARQVVILGAGFDCRAYRLPEMQRVRVIEVDHPDTSAAKQRHMQRLLGRLPEHVQFLSIDFNREYLADRLASTRFDRSVPTVFLWEGVTNYLDDSAIDTTFRALSSATDECVVLFTYVDKAVINGQRSFPGETNIRQSLKHLGEVWTFGFVPEELPEYLRERGFCLIEDASSVEYRRRYGLPARDRRGYEFYHVVVASSAPRNIVDLFGKVEYEPSYDYKSPRRKR